MKRKLTPDETQAYRDLARAAKRLREAQRKADKRQEQKQKQKGGGA